jgi:hypothetical protein
MVRDYRSIAPDYLFFFRVCPAYIGRVALPHFPKGFPMYVHLVRSRLGAAATVAAVPRLHAPLHARLLPLQRHKAGVP